jgi:hypothetical protein
MEWKNFRQAKGQNVQSFTQEFRRRALVLGVDLSSQETLLKYIGALHSYLRHTILMFNPTNLDEVCVQANHLEARGRNDTHEGFKKTYSQGDKEKKKFKGNGRKNAAVKKEGEKFTCKHCSKDGHDEDHCWKLHPYYASQGERVNLWSRGSHGAGRTTQVHPSIVEEWTIRPSNTQQQFVQSTSSSFSTLGKYFHGFCWWFTYVEKRS